MPILNLLRKGYFKFRLFKKQAQWVSLPSLLLYHFIKKPSGTLRKIYLKKIGKEIYIRQRNPIDFAVIEYVLADQFHLPPDDYQMPNNPVIVDLGTNIGLTILHFKYLYPTSHIIGYEMDIKNYEIAQRNTKGLSKIDLHNKAVWINKDEIFYNSTKNSDGYKIELENNTTLASKIKVQGITISDIIASNNIIAIDYLKMDIEGAEVEIFKNDDLTWLNYVNCLNIEFHDIDSNQLNYYIKILQQNGFNAWKDEKHWLAIKAIKEKYTRN